MPSSPSPHRKVALLAAALRVEPKAEVQLLPAGEFAARDGRPGKDLMWRLDDSAGQALAATLTRDSAATQFLVDYDHQTLYAGLNSKAPAAGWASTFEWRDGTGLFAIDVRWTDAALSSIRSGEYRYVSPVIAYDQRSGQVLTVQMAAITNFPALTGMQALGDALMAQLAACNTLSLSPAHASPRPQDSDMDIVVTLAALMGLAAGATPDAVVASVKDLLGQVGALKDKQGKATALSTALAGQLGLKDGFGVPEVTAALAALRGDGHTATATIAALQAQLAGLTTQCSALQTEITAGKVADVVTAALAAGKLVPAQKDWAIGMGTKDLPMLEAYLKATPVIAPLKAQTNGKAPAGSDSEGGEVDSAALAAKAMAYQTEQAGKGITVTTVDAVRHVNTSGAKA